jgi:hypothetical protein
MIIKGDIRGYADGKNIKFFWNNINFKSAFSMELWK